MPTNYNLPGSGQYTFNDYIGINSQDNSNSLFPSVLMQGGFQEMPTVQDRNEIPVAYASSTGYGVPKIGGDGWSSGRRRVGMLVHVLDAGSGTPKMYTLIPQGYFGNGGNLGAAEWNALTDAQKFELLDPTATYNGGFTPPNNYTQAGGNGTANDCWVEISLASGAITGNLIPDQNEAYDLGSPDKKFRDLYLSGNTLYMGGQPLSIVNGQLTLNGTPVTGSTDAYNASVINNTAAPASSFSINKKIRHAITDPTGSGFPDPKAAFLVNDNRLVFVSKTGLEVYKSSSNSGFEDLNGLNRGGQWVLEGEIISTGSDYFSGAHSIDNGLIAATGNTLLIGSNLFEYDGVNWSLSGRFQSGSFLTTSSSSFGLARSSNIATMYANSPNNISIDTEIVLISELINGTWTTYHYFREGGPGNTWQLGDVLANRGRSTISWDGQRIMTTNELTKSLEIYHFDQSLLSHSQNPTTNYILVHTDTTSKTTNAAYPRRGGFNKNRTLSLNNAGQFHDNNVASFMAIVDNNGIIDQQQIHFLKWNGSSYQSSGYIEGGTYVFDHNGTRAIRHLYTSGVHKWDIWGYDAVGNTWSQLTDTQLSTSSVGFSTDSNLNILTVEEDLTIGTSPEWILYNTTYSNQLTKEFGVPPVNQSPSTPITRPYSRILNIEQAIVGQDIYLEFDETLAYQEMQNCTVYIHNDWYNWLECKVLRNLVDVNSNGDNITTLHLLVTRKFGNRSSYNYSVRQ